MIFTLLPVILLASAQLLVALLLLAPMTIASPALRLCKLSQTPVGQTCLATMSVVLVVSLISPVLDLQDLRAQRNVRYSQSSPSNELDNMHRRDSEALNYLSIILTTFCFFMNFVLRRLGLALGKLELATLKETTLLKQVKGLHAEYDRLASQKGRDSETRAGDAALEAAVKSSKDELSTLQKRLELEVKKRKNAELNLDALKSQSRGLESEYDSLLASYNSLQKTASRLDPKLQSSSDDRSWKKDWSSQRDRALQQRSDTGRDIARSGHTHSHAKEWHSSKRGSQRGDKSNNRAFQHNPYREQGSRNGHHAHERRHGVKSGLKAQYEEIRQRGRWQRPRSRDRTVERVAEPATLVERVKGTADQIDRASKEGPLVAAQQLDSRELARQDFQRSQRARTERRSGANPGDRSSKKEPDRRPETDTSGKWGHDLFEQEMDDQQKDPDPLRLLLW